MGKAPRLFGGNGELTILELVQEFYRMFRKTHPELHRQTPISGQVFQERNGLENPGIFRELGRVLVRLRLH